MCLFNVNQTVKLNSTMVHIYPWTYHQSQCLNMKMCWQIRGDLVGLSMVIFLFSQIDKHEDPKMYQGTFSKCQSKWTTFSGFQIGGHFSAHFQVGQPHNFDLIIVYSSVKPFESSMDYWMDKLEIWMDDWLSLRQLADQIGLYNWWAFSIFTYLKYKEVLWACIYTTSH